MPHLLYVPVVHSNAEMGSAATGYQAAFIARFGEQKWRERCDEYNAIWRAITEGVNRAIKWRSVPMAQSSSTRTACRSAATRARWSSNGRAGQRQPQF